MKNKEFLSKGINFSSITIILIIIAPLLITMGFKGIKLETSTVGWVFLILGSVIAVIGMLFLAKGITFLLDYLFEK